MWFNAMFPYTKTSRAALDRLLDPQNPTVTLHTLQGYAFGRRQYLKPPEELLERWRNVRDLEGMMTEWGKTLDVDQPDVFGSGIAQKVAQRIRDGNFILAVLLEMNSDTLKNKNPI